MLIQYLTNFIDDLLHYTSLFLRAIAKAIPGEPAQFKNASSSIKISIYKLAIYYSIIA